MVHVWSENNLQEMVLSSYHVCPGDQTQVSRLCNKCLYLLRWLFYLSLCILN